MANPELDRTRMREAAMILVDAEPAESNRPPVEDISWNVGDLAYLVGTHWRVVVEVTKVEENNLTTKVVWESGVGKVTTTNQQAYQKKMLWPLTKEEIARAMAYYAARMTETMQHLTIFKKDKSE